jgi:phage/plasmid primase-like uncharacterized protein
MMSLEQQKQQHLQFLRNEGLVVSNLVINSTEFIRNGAVGESRRGEYAYKTASRILNNGMMGLITWCRSKDGKINTFRTYGKRVNLEKINPETSFQAIKDIALDGTKEKIRMFWELSSKHGVSDYLIRKNAGSYRIRFRENQYGRVAIVPVMNIYDQLCGYQILNSNGSKVFAKGMQLFGAYHRLTRLSDHSIIGMAESYVTAATCLELCSGGIQMVTAFSSDNLQYVATALKKHYPNSFLVIFADNDKHLSENKGMINAIKALERIQGGGIILSPLFEIYQQGREYSDWNDLVRERGHIFALQQVIEGLKEIEDERGKGFYAKIKELLNF